MSHNMPLILAGGLMPMLRWLRTNGRPVDSLLAQADLSFLPYIDPQQPIPLKNGIRLLGELSLHEAPDIGLRMVSDHSVRELAFIGRVALGARTPREAFERIALAIPYHSSHEVFDIQRSNGQIIVRQGWSLSISDRELHFIQQYFTAIIERICTFTLLHQPLFDEVRMLPHPEFGLSHLQEHFGGRLKPARNRLAKITIANSVADCRFFKVARDRNLHTRLADVSNLNFDGSLVASSKAVLGLQFLDGTPSIARLAEWADISQRTFQRRLKEEGASFSDLLEAVRKEMALKFLTESHDSMDHIAAKLGYERQSTLTRAVRRWTGKTPSQIRQG